MHIGIIGSGPCGAVASLYLLKLGHEVTLLDIDSNHEEGAEKYRHLRPPLKSVNEDLFPYDFDTYTPITVDNGERRWFPSKAGGGFSNIWGGTWKPFEDLKSERWEFAHKTVQDLVDLSFSYGLSGDITKSKFSCECFNSLINFQKHSLSKDGMVLGKVNIATSRQFTIGNSTRHLCNPTMSLWNSRQLLRLCEEFEGYKFVSSFNATSIKLSNEAIICTSALGQKFEFDRVLLAAGPIGITNLLLRNFSWISEIKLSDTQMLTTPVLGLKIGRKGLGFPAATSFIETPLSQGATEYRSHSQFYSHVQNYSKNIIAYFPNFAKASVAYLLKFMSSHFLICITYLDSQISSKIVFRFDQNSLRAHYLFNPSHRSQIRLMMWALFKKFLKLRLLFLFPISSVANPGDSFHLTGGELEFIDENGGLREDRRIGVCGSFGLPINSPGPITFSAMAQTILACDGITKI